MSQTSNDQAPAEDEDTVPLPGLIDFLIYAVTNFGPPAYSGTDNPVAIPQWVWEGEEDEEAFSISTMDEVHLGVWIESDDAKYLPLLQFAKDCGLNVKSKADA